MDEAIAYLQQNADYLGMSIDIDGFDPILCPGVSTPSPNGIDPQAFISYLKKLDSKLVNPIVGLEIAEFNPSRDKQNQSLSIVLDIIQALEKKMPQEIT